ncbi:hypothetical protein ACOME3_002288 [Neoechinorhynchus agilis]
MAYDELKGRFVRVKERKDYNQKIAVSARRPNDSNGYVHRDVDSFIRNMKAVEATTGNVDVAMRTHAFNEGYSNGVIYTRDVLKAPTLTWINNNYPLDEILILMRRYPAAYKYLEACTFRDAEQSILKEHNVERWTPDFLTFYSKLDCPGLNRIPNSK